MPATTPALPAAALTAAELDGFHRFATQRLQSQAAQSLEDCLRAWRNEQEHQEALADIRAGLADVAAGRVRDYREVMREIREELQLPAGK